MTDAPKNRVTKSATSPPRTSATARAPQNAAFEQEVDEELQRDRLHELWEQYSGYVLAGAIAIVLGVGGYKLMESKRLAQMEAEGARYTVAVKQLTDTPADPTHPALDSIAKGTGGFAMLAQMRLAGAEAVAGKAAEAAARYDAASQMRGADVMLADFARLQSAMLQLDTAPWADLKAKLAPLAVDANPWRHGAREVLGMAALKAGNRSEARMQFEKLISDTAVPAGIAERARIVMGSLAAAELAEKGPLAPAPVVATTPAPAVAVPANGAPAEKKK